MLELLAATGAAVPGLAVRTTVLLVLAWGGLRLLPRRASAAVVHMAWTMALVGVLGLPVLALVVPSWTIEVRRVASSPVPLAVADESNATRDLVADPLERDALALAQTEDARPTTEPLPSFAAATPIPPLAWVGALYLLGVTLALALVLWQRWQVRRWCHDAQPIADEAWLGLLTRCVSRMAARGSIRLLRGGHVVPMTCGTWRPTIVVPAAADGWDDERREAVLLHELAHVVRRDCFTQVIASLACALAWFHPGVWWMARRMRHERELACDDLVVATGAPARGYAAHLLEIAYACAHDAAPVQALAMARPRQLEARMRALLDSSRDRRTPGMLTRLALAGAIALVVLPMAALRATVVDVAPVAVVSAAPQTLPRPALTAAGTLAVPVAEPRPAAASSSAAVSVADQVRAVVKVAAQTKQDVSLALQQAASAIRNDTGPDASGTWDVTPGGKDGTVQLRMTQGRSMNGHTMRLDAFTGLAEALRTSGTPVTFRLTRDAGTFTFEGTFRGGVGAGVFSYAADPTFAEALVRRGFARPTAQEQYQMARYDVGLAFVDALAATGYATPQTALLVKAGQHGVSAAYVTDMAGLGYRLGTLDALITLRDHGVTPAYVRELGTLGYANLPADDVRRARDHGITPDYVRGLKDSGGAGLSMDQLIRVRDHGVTPEYVSTMRSFGYREALDDLVKARDHGISADYVREMAELGYGRLPLDLLIRMRDHGISTRYVRELKDMGYGRIEPADLITLRDHGFSAERISQINSRAGSRLPVPALLELRRSGKSAW